MQNKTELESTHAVALFDDHPIVAQAVSSLFEAHPQFSVMASDSTLDEFLTKLADLPSHPTHAIAKQTMRGFGGLVTFLIKDADWRQTADVVDRVKIPRIGPSLGGVESLIEQPLVMSYFQLSPEDRKRFGISDSMIRLSCGLEDARDLIADLSQALAAS